MCETSLAVTTADEPIRMVGDSLSFFQKILRQFLGCGINWIRDSDLHGHIIRVQHRPGHRE